MFHHDSKGSVLKSTLQIMVILFAIVFVYSTMTRTTVNSGAGTTMSCQSNLNQIGKAIKSYMHDWDDKYPTNRLPTGKLHYHIPLSEDIMVNNQPVIFQYGVNWVEALYPYIERVGTPGDNTSVWCCPSICTKRWFRKPLSEPSTYALNMNLLEQSEQIVTEGGNTMLVREMDRQFGAVCRPINISKDSKTRPKGAFLTEWDPELPRGTKCKAQLHGPGSVILFTDGHVKTISSAAMPTDEKLVWDETTKQWWNASEGAKKFIAINP